ncbi:MAG: dTDP-glucose pyrophosphorylase [Candidatus Binatia bacterium]|nr:dTDP-glucose pyrophosphorylase [Candidatus Binatia bacterium]
MTPDKHQDPRPQSEVIGVVPAAGKGTRLAPLPCSKELYPIGFAQTGATAPRPKAVSEYLFDKFRAAGIRKSIIIIRTGKWDIPAYFGDGQLVGMDLAYLVISDSWGPPATIDRAYPFVKEARVAFGFPDILFGPTDVFVHLLRHQADTGCDVVLGLYPAHDPRSMDMVDLDPRGRVRAIELKPHRTQLTYAWICAVWTPAFTDFLHRFLAAPETQENLALLANPQTDPSGDLPVGAVLRAAVQAGLRTEGVCFPAETYLDIGTPAALSVALTTYSRS